MTVAVVTFMWQPVQTLCSSATIAASPLLSKRRSNRSSKSSSIFAANSARSFVNSCKRDSKTLESRLQELTNERAELAAKIDEDLLDRFERLFESKGDAAIVALEHNVCTGCHMKVTTATIMHAKAGKEIVNCEQCGRILYVSE